MDTDYHSQANMAEFTAHNRKFLTLLATDVPWVREVVDALRDEIDDRERGGLTVSLFCHGFARRLRKQSQDGV